MVPPPGMRGPARPSVLLSLSQESKSQERGCNSRSSGTCTLPGGTRMGRRRQAHGVLCTKADTVERRSFPKETQAVLDMEGILDRLSVDSLLRSAAVCQVTAVDEQSPLNHLLSGEG